MINKSAATAAEKILSVCSDSGAYTVFLVREEIEFDRLKIEWEALLIRCTSGHLHHDFSWKWRSWKNIAAPNGQQLLIIAARKNLKLVFLLPLVIKNRIARFLNSETFEYRDLLLDMEAFDESWLRPTWLSIIGLKDFDILFLQNIRLPSNFSKLIGKNTAPTWTIEASSPVIRMEGFTHWDAFAASRSKRLMADQRRQWRRIISAAPSLQCKVANSLDEVTEMLDWIIGQKREWAKKKGGLKMIWNGRRRQFLSNVITDAYQADRLVATKLYQNDQIISAGIGFTYNKQFTFEIFSYDEAWENFSPSRLLQEKIIRWCIENGIEEFDFLPGGGSPYKHLWASDYVTSTSYIIATSFRGSVRIWLQKYTARLVHIFQPYKTIFKLAPATIKLRFHSMLSKGLPLNTVTKLFEKTDR